MIDFDIIPKIIALVLAVGGIIGLIITVPTLLESTPNIAGFVTSLVAMAGAGAIIKLFS